MQDTFIFPKDSHAEVREQHFSNRSVGIICGNLTNNARTNTSGVSARVYKNGTYGFASMAETTEEAAKRVLDAAKSNAEFMDIHVSKGKAPLPCFGKGKRALETFSELDRRDPEQKEYIDFAREIDDYIKTKYPNLASRYVVANSNDIEKILRVSDGCDGHTRLVRSYVYVGLTAETPDGKPVELFKAFGGEGTFSANFNDPKKLFGEIDIVHQRLMEKREGIYADAGEKTVVLGGMMAGMLAHEAVGHTVEADLVLGGSIAAHNLGKQVASELVNLTDFAHTAFGKNAPLPVYVDDEGILAEDAKIIENGILTGYLNNRQSARHFGMIPKGNARAWSFSDEPLIRMRNTAIHPGNDKLSDMIASVEDGYYLIDSGNGQADTTGEFMFGVTMGYEIKNGKLGKALLDTTISGVAFEMLKTVDMVSDEVVWSSSGYCGKKQRMPVGMGGPALRCKVMIGGR